MASTPFRILLSTVTLAVTASTQAPTPQPTTPQPTTPQATSPQPPTSRRPAYQFVRQNEDWSQFRADPASDDKLDALKHINLNDSGDTWLSFGGHARARLELWDGFGFGATSPTVPSNSDSFILSRLMLHADLHVGEHVRFWVEGITAQSTDRDLAGGRRTSDVDTFDLYQAFADFSTELSSNSSISLRVGRQSWLLGAQRVITPSPWGNTLNKWDGVSAEWRNDTWTILGLAGYFVPIKPTQTNKNTQDEALFGVYATHNPGNNARSTDLYALGNTRPAEAGQPRTNGTAGNQRRQTFGVRNYGALFGNFQGEIEAAYQTGEAGNQNVTAWFTSGVLSYTMRDTAWTPMLFTGYDLASGDHRAGGAVNTYDSLYPLGHRYLGFADVVGRENIEAGHLGVTVTPCPNTTLSLRGHLFRLMDKDDALYGTNGRAARTGFQSANVGQEIDFVATQQIGRHLDLLLGYSHFFTGASVAATGSASDVDFGYLSVTYTF